MVRITAIADTIQKETAPNSNMKAGRLVDDERIHTKQIIRCKNKTRKKKIKRNEDTNE